MNSGRFKKGEFRTYQKKCCVCTESFEGLPQIRHCSKKCFLIMNRNIDENGCWLWLGRINQSGYGTTSYSKTLHRLSWETFNGMIPEGMFVCHSCDVKNCYNPEHLFIGTPKDNTQDAIKKGLVGNNRQKLSRRKKIAKLNENDVSNIRHLLQNKIPIRTIASEFNISRGSIEGIKYNKTWKDLSVLK